MVKKKNKKKSGVKGLHLPTPITYSVAGMGVLFIIIFLVFLLVKGGGKKELTEDEKETFNSVISRWQKEGTIIKTEKTKENKDEAILFVNEDKWEKMPSDSKEVICFSVSKSLDIKTLFVKNENENHLGTYFVNGRLFEKR